MGSRSSRTGAAGAVRLIATPPTASADGRDALIERFLPLARRMAGRYHRHPKESLDDLVQVASLGLVKAARRYDESRGVPFAAFAISCIDGELKNYLRDRTWAVHVPRRAKERAVRLKRAVTACEREGVAPTTARLAERLGLTEHEFLDARWALSALDATSMDALGTDTVSYERPLAETLGSLDDSYKLIEDRSALESALRMLPVGDRRILRMRFFEDKSQAEIAAWTGKSQMQVSRNLRAALARLEVACGGGGGMVL